MGFRVTIEGPEIIYLGEEIISQVEADIATPGDSRARSTQDLASMQISGKLYTIDGGPNSETIKLFEWAQAPAEKAEEAYRKVTAEIIAKGQVFRKIEMTKAFVIGYNERYNDMAGYGEFTLVIRQKADKIAEVKAESGLGVGEGALGALAGGGTDTGFAQAPKAKGVMERAVENAGRAAAAAAIQKALHKVDPTGAASSAVQAAAQGSAEMEKIPVMTTVKKE